MAGKLDLLLEAEKRGILPDDKKVLLDEARKRGLVPGFDPAQQAVQENTVARAIGENVKGGLTAVADMLTGIPGMVAGGLSQGLMSLGANANDAPLIEKIGQEGAQRITRVIRRAIVPDAMETAIAPDRESGAYHNLMLPFEKMREGYKEIGRTVEMWGGLPTARQFGMPMRPGEEITPAGVTEGAPDSNTGASIGANTFDAAMGILIGRDVAKAPGRWKEARAKEQAQKLVEEEKLIREQEAAQALKDKEFVLNRQREVAAAQAEAKGLQGELVQQRINEMNMRNVVPEMARAPEPPPALPEGATLEAPTPTPTDPMGRQLGGRDLAPILKERELAESGVTSEPAVQPALDFKGRAEHHVNLYEILNEAQGDRKTTLHYAVERVRQLWKDVESKMQEASDARLAKTNLGTVKRGQPDAPMRAELEARRADIAKMADELHTAYGEYLTEGDRMSMGAIRKIHEMSTSPKIGGLDMAGRSDVIERTQSGRDMGIGKPSEAFLNAARKNQGGYIHPSLIQEGVRKLIDTIGERATLARFKGVFSDRALKFALSDTRDPKSRTTLVWMSPDEFHQLAERRLPGGESPHSQQAVRSVLNTDRADRHGLDSLPQLDVGKTADGKDFVSGHEGRHRMDVFKERGLDLVPVLVRHHSVRWGENPYRPKNIESQDGPRYVHPKFDLVNLNKSPKMPSGVGAKEGGAIHFTASMEDVRNGPLARAFREAFAHLKREYPRFSELRDIKVMTGKEWERKINGLIRTGKIDKSNKQEFLEATGMHTTGQDIVINGNHWAFENKDIDQMVDTLAHELTHEWQDKRGQADKIGGQTERDWKDRELEQRALAAGTTANTRVMYAPRDKATLDFAVKNGDYTPLGKSLKLNSKDQFQQFKSDMAKQGVDFLSDAHARAMFNKSKREGTWTPGSETESIGKVTSGIKGLQDLTDQYLNNWTPEQMTKAVEAWGKDIAFGTKNTIKKIINGRFVAKTHPLLKYVSSNIHRIKNDSRLRAEANLMGDAYDAKGNRVPEKGSPMDIWSRLDDKSREVLNDVGQHFTNKSDALVTDADLNAAAKQLHGRELTPDEIQSYRQRRKGMDRAWKALNDYIVAHPKPNGALRDPLPYLPNFWSPAEFGGKFLIFVKDKVSGEVQGMQGSYFMPDMKKLAAEFPEHTVSFVEKDIRNNLNPEALEATIRYLAEPKRAAVRQALNEAMKSQGFSKHAKQRTGIEGWLGSEGGKKGVKNYEQVYEEYVRSTYNHIANRELDALHTELSDNTKVREIAPRALDLGLESVDQARGRMNAGMAAFEKEVGAALNAARLPQSFLGDIGKVANEYSVKSFIAFGKISNIVANILQAPTTAPIKALMIAAENAGMGALDSTTTIMKVGAKTMKDLLKPDAQAIKDVIGLRREGALEANFQYDYKEYNRSAAHAALNKPKDWITMTAPLTWIESNIVRKPAGLLFVNLLRELKYPENNIYRLATELTDQYEATSKQYEAAHIFGRSGLVGRMAKPLESFTTTWVGTYLEALQSALRNPTSAAHALPLLYGLGTMYLVTGLMGMPGVKEWDAVAGAINKLANTTFPTATELIMKHTKSQEARFGYLWGKIGLNLGTTMSAPTATQSVAPGVQFIGNAANALGTGLRATGVFGDYNKPTQAEKREAIKGITPASSWGFTESYFTHPSTKPTLDRLIDNPTGTYTNSKSEGSIVRDNADWNARKWLGAFTTKEAEAKARNWEVNRTQREMQSHRSDLVQLMVDDYINTGKLDPKLMDRATKLEYTGKELREAMRRELLDHYLPKDAQMQGKGTSLKQQRAARLLQELR